MKTGSTIFDRHISHVALRCFGAMWLIAVATWHGEAAAQSRDAFRDARTRMVADAIESEGVSNPRVLAAMREVPRHEFVRPDLRKKAYFDQALPIGYGQTISPPYIVAYMTETIDPQKTDRVLEIGTGSGYQAAVLSLLVQEVYTIEIVEQLGKQAERRLKKLDYENVHARVGDGYAGWPENAPFDKIFVTCSPEDVPQPLVDQLREGGRMLIPLGERYQQVFYLFEKKDGKLVQTKLLPTLFVPMTGVSEDNRDVKPDPLKPEIVNGGFELDDNDDGRPDGWHYQRQASFDDENAPDGKYCLRFESPELNRPAQALQGMAIDGSKISAVFVRLRMKMDDVQIENAGVQMPGFLVHFYDFQRRSLGTEVMGPWVGTREWQEISAKLNVPAKAREAVVQIGLNGAMGTLYVDDIQLQPVER